MNLIYIFGRTHLINQMAKSYKNSYDIFFPIFSKNELIKNMLEIFIDNNNTFIFILTTFCIFIFVFILILDLSYMYIDMNLQRAIKLALKLFIKIWEYSHI